MKDGGLHHLPPLTEGELAAYLDGDLEAGRRAALNRRLDANPVQRDEVERIRLAEAELLASLDAMLTEPVPAHLLALLDDLDEAYDATPPAAATALAGGSGSRRRD
ncbi:MAG: hypothetical protein WCZ23_05930 [Rhodospirillaceae bacterium]